jgi:hypothetical protein
MAAQHVNACSSMPFLDAPTIADQHHSTQQPCNQLGMLLIRVQLQAGMQQQLFRCSTTAVSDLLTQRWLFLYHLLLRSSLAFSNADITAGDEGLTQPLLSPYDAAAAADAAETGVPLLLEKDEPVVKEEAHK